MGDEQFLIKRILGGDGEAFRQIVDQYKGYVFAVILSLVRDRDQAEGIAQEVFIQVYRSLPQYRLQNFRSWLGKIAVNKAIDWRRAQTKFSQETPVGDWAEVVDAAAADGETPEKLVLRREDQKRVREICSGLPDIYRRVMIQFYLEEKSCQEIALLEGVSMKTVESRLYRARVLFRQRWGEGA